MKALQFLLAMLGAASFACLLLYIYLLYSGRSLTLYSSVDTRLMNWPKRVFFALAAVGALVCLYQGAEALLFWIPMSWLTVGDTDVGLRSHLASAFAFYGGVFLLISINRATHTNFFLHEANTEKHGLSRMLIASRGELAALKEEFENEVGRLNKVLDEINRHQGSSARHAQPADQLLQIYRRLLALLEKRITEAERSEA